MSFDVQTVVVLFMFVFHRIWLSMNSLTSHFEDHRWSTAVLNCGITANLDQVLVLRIAVI